MSHNGQTHFKNLTGNAAILEVKCAWPVWDIIHKRVKYVGSDNTDLEQFNLNDFDFINSP